MATVIKFTDELEGITAQKLNKAFAQVASGGGGGTGGPALNTVTRETPAGSVNGVNTAFVLAYTPTAGTEEVYLNGILQEPGAGNDYTISAATITMLAAPLSGDRLRVSYLRP